MFEDHIKYESSLSSKAEAVSILVVLFLYYQGSRGKITRNKKKSIPDGSPVANINNYRNLTMAAAKIRTTSVTKEYMSS